MVDEVRDELCEACGHSLLRHPARWKGYCYDCHGDCKYHAPQKKLRDALNEVDKVMRILRHIEETVAFSERLAKASIDARDALGALGIYLDEDDDG